VMRQEANRFYIDAQFEEHMRYKKVQQEYVSFTQPVTCQSLRHKSEGSGGGEARLLFGLTALLMSD
nr:hypothetical protein [Tanacetum cinerariifolium]